MFERLRADWPLKLLALVLAFGIWLSITGEDPTLRDFSVPVELQLPPDRVSATAPPTTVIARLEGSESAIRKLDPLRLTVRLDLRQSPLGRREVQLSEAHLAGVPPGVRVAFFNPDRLQVAVDRRLHRELPVAPRVVGDPPAGFHYYGAVARPRAVEVEGPESAVAAMSELGTDPIALGQRTGSFVVLVGALAEVAQVKTVTPGPIEVQVTIDVPPIPRTLANVPVRIEGGAGNLDPDPRTVRVSIAGPPKVVQSIAASQIRAVADVAAQQPGDRHHVPVQARLVDVPDDQLRRVVVTSVVPSRVAVRDRPRGPS
jgi:YbbR domain-containing protein